MSKELQSLSFDSLTSPAAIVRQLESRSLDELAGMFRRAEVAGLRAWMLAALVVGVALEKARYGDDATGALAEKFQSSRRTINRLSSIFRQLLRPRLETVGHRAEFPLSEAAYYVTSIEVADTIGKRPLEVLEQAEQRRAKDPKLTVRRFRQDLLGDDGSPDETRSLLRLLQRIAKADPQSIAEVVAAAPENLGTLLNVAIENLTTARASVTPHRERQASGTPRPEHPVRGEHRSTGGGMNR